VGADRLADGVWLFERSPTWRADTLFNACPQSCLLRYPDFAARLAMLTGNENHSVETLRNEKKDGYFQASTPARWIAHRFWGARQ
jgi:hypothetical protein